MNVNHKNKDNNKKRWYVFFTSNYKRSEAKQKRKQMIVYGRKMFCLQTKAFRGVLCRSSFVFPLLPPEQISICKEMHFSYYTEFSFRTNQLENGKWKLTLYDYIGGLDHDF